MSDRKRQERFCERRGGGGRDGDRKEANSYLHAYGILLTMSQWWGLNEER